MQPFLELIVELTQNVGVWEGGPPFTGGLVGPYLELMLVFLRALLTIFIIQKKSLDKFS